MLLQGLLISLIPHAVSGEARSLVRSPMDSRSKEIV